MRIASSPLQLWYFYTLALCALLSTDPQMVLLINLLVWVRHLFFILLAMLKNHLKLTIFRGFNLFMINNWELINYLSCQGLWICTVPTLARTLPSSCVHIPLQQIIILRPQLLLCALNNCCWLPLISCKNAPEQSTVVAAHNHIKAKLKLRK